MCILSRTALYEYKNGRYRRLDWNIVNTSIGAMWEPVSIDDYNEDASSDPDDIMRKIDSMEFGWDRREQFHRDLSGDEILIGGQLTLDLDVTYK